MSSSSTNPLESSPVNDPGPDQDTTVNDPADSSIPEQVSHCTGLRVVSIDSESDSDYLQSDDPYSFDLGSHEEVLDGGGFEWEEVAGESNDVVEEVTALSSDYFTDDEEDEQWEVGWIGGGRGRRSAVRGLDWELLVAGNNVTGNLFFSNDVLYVIDDANYVENLSNTLFDQFMGNMAEIRESPPAAKEVVENLPVVIVEEGDSELNGGDCAVCKDEVGVGVRVRTLPCSHYYHEECILPWLRMRNTCPMCRYELPTDDAEYEQNKSWNGQGRPVSWD